MRLRLLLLLVLGLLLQSSVLPQLRVFGVMPDLMVIVGVSVGLLRGPVEGAVVGSVGGLMLDLMRGQNLGLMALSLGITGFLAGLLEKRLFKDNVLVPLLGAFFGTLVSQMLFLVLAASFGIVFPWWSSLLRVVLPMAVYNAILGPLIFGWVANLSARPSTVDAFGRRGGV